MTRFTTNKLGKFMQNISLALQYAIFSLTRVNFIKEELREREVGIDKKTFLSWNCEPVW